PPDYGLISGAVSHPPSSPPPRPFRGQVVSVQSCASAAIPNAVPIREQDGYPSAFQPVHAALARSGFDAGFLQDLSYTGPRFSIAALQWPYAAISYGTHTQSQRPQDYNGCR